MRPWLLALVLASLPAGCKSETGSNVSLERSGDAPPVVEVEGSAQVDLAAAKEVEPNDSREKATSLELPVAVAGVLADEKDVDFFKLVAARSGPLVATVDEVDGVDVAIELLNEAGEVLAAADRGPAQTSEGVPNYPIRKGDTVYVAIKEFVDPRRKKRRKRRKRKGDEKDEPEQRPPYRLEVRMLEGAPDELEREPNSEADAAPTVLLGDRPSGYIGWNKDVDLWKLSLQGFGENNLIDLSVEGVDGVKLNLVLENAAGDKILERTSHKSGSLYVRGLAVSESPHLIARISGDKSHETQRYRLQFGTRHRDDGAEVEPNDSGKTATELTGEAAGGGSGHLTEDDVDYFTIEPVPEPVSLTIAVEGAAGVTFELEAWAGGKKIGETKARGKVELFGMNLSGNQRVRFRIKGDGISGDPASYSITWMHGAVEPTEPVVPDGTTDPADLLE